MNKVEIQYCKRYRNTIAILLCNAKSIAISIAIVFPPSIAIVIAILLSVLLTSYPLRSINKVQDHELSVQLR